MRTSHLSHNLNTLPSTEAIQVSQTIFGAYLSYQSYVTERYYEPTVYKLF